MQVSTRNIIRFLSFLSFIILFCPFFQTCSDKSISNLPKIKENNNIFQKNQLIKKSKKEYTFNGYQIAYIFADETFFIKERRIVDLTDFLDSMISISFIILILFSIWIFYLSLFNNNIIYKISILNLSVLLISIILLTLEKNFENINQIKIGFYLFLLNSILIIYFCRKELKLSK